MVLGKEGGRAIRADQRLEASEPPALRRWSLQVAGSPFERLLTASVVEARLDGATLHLSLRQQPRGWGAPRRLHAAPRGAPPARRGARRHGARRRALVAFVARRGRGRRSPRAAARPSRNASSTRNAHPTTVAPSRSTSSASARAVPPVARRSSWIEHPRPVGERVRVHLEHVDPVLEDVLRGHDLGRELARLARRDEARAELARDRRAEDEAARLRRHDEVDAARARPTPRSPRPTCRPRAGRAAAA